MLSVARSTSRFRGSSLLVVFVNRLSCQAESDGRQSAKTYFSYFKGLVVIAAATYTAGTVSSSTHCDAKERKRKIPVCGEWCEKADCETPCMMDHKLMPCRGEHCQTKAGLWNLFVLGPRTKHRPVPCEMYKAGIGYPIGGTPCDANCLIEEISPTRYPMPTGFGVFCKPGTCIPAASPRHKRGEALGSLQCPCNWFGSECEDDWLPLKSFSKRHLEHLDHVTIHLDKAVWRKVVKDYKPGCVVRLSMKDEKGNVFDMACAIPHIDQVGQLDMLVAPANPSLAWEVRHICDTLRGMDTGSHDNKWNMKVNPLIAGFQNGYWVDMMNALKKDAEVENMVIVSTGSGLSGALSAVEALVSKTTKKRKITWYHGLRDLKGIPFSDRLEKLIQNGQVELIVLESRYTKNDDTSTNVSPGIAAAAQRGRATQETIQKSRGLFTLGKKVYVQDAIEWDLSLSDTDALHKTAFVICGSLNVMESVRAVCLQLLQLHGCFDDKIHKKLLNERIFLNI
jgi:hypothetical protein